MDPAETHCRQQASADGSALSVRRAVPLTLRRTTGHAVRRAAAYHGGRAYLALRRSTDLVVRGAAASRR
jgi:hypothetical protein